MLIVMLIIGSVAAIAIPNMLAARKNGNEAGAIGSLKAISTAQRLFREGDKEGDKIENERRWTLLWVACKSPNPCPYSVQAGGAFLPRSSSLRYHRARLRERYARATR